MNWSRWRPIPWIDTRARFVAGTPRTGSLLDLGSSDGSTLCHMWELRPDLRFSSVDIAGQPARVPPGTTFARADLERDRLPWPDQSFDAITCMHVVEHLRTMDRFWEEVARLLRPNGRVYIETPGTESVNTASPPASLRGKVTMNFYDDPTHIAPVSIQALDEAAARSGLTVISTGRSRNWFFAAVYPLFALLPATRRRYVAKLHWLGWSAYLIAQKPAS
ncbi:MAG TPA: class I SAM-dependent methyltransferase [Gemmatimonadaceae bacterium]|nr:class I SAM-dependent methyltransferase [Gemmatimonadaceae bacterium]